MPDYELMPYWGLNTGGWPMRMFNEEWAQRNHCQSLQTLASRGGLDAAEALAIVQRRPHKAMRESDAALEMDRLESELSSEEIPA